MKLSEAIREQLKKNPNLTATEAYQLNPGYYPSSIRLALTLATRENRIAALESENEGLIYEVHDTAEKLRNMQFTLDKITADRNRYASLYDGKCEDLKMLGALRERNLESLRYAETANEKHSKLIDRLTLALVVSGGLTVALGAIVACVFFKL